MAPPTFELSAAEAKAYIKPPILEFVAAPFDYDDLTRQAIDLAAHGSLEALFVPAVKLITETTLQVVTNPAIEPRIPREVYLRREAALYSAEYATNLVVAVNALGLFYRNAFVANEAPVELIEEVGKAIRDKKYLLSIGQAPFFDACMVSGAALRLLQQKQVSENPAEVITRSTGLLAVSGIYKGYAVQAMEFLGYPYANTDHLVVKDGEEGVEVALTPTAKTFLNGLHVRGRGCPAGKIEVDGTGRTLLEQEWGRIVRYLIPPDATAVFERTA